MCQRLYFPTEDYTVATFLTVNSCLHYLFTDLQPELANQYGLEKSKLLEYAKLCSVNVMSAIRLWGIGMDNTFDNLLALTLSVSSPLELYHS